MKSFKKKKREREKEIVNPEVNRVEQKDRVKFLSTCIHSFTDTYGRVYAGALLVNTFGGSNRQFTCLLWGLVPGLISQVHALSSEAASHNHTGAWAVKRTDLGSKSHQKGKHATIKSGVFHSGLTENTRISWTEHLFAQINHPLLVWSKMNWVSLALLRRCACEAASKRKAWRFSKNTWWCNDRTM